MEEDAGPSKTMTWERRLHLVAAVVLARLDLRKEAAEKCKEGLAFEPHDPHVRGLLEQFSQALTGEHGEMPVGSGTGFCVAQGNYVLTNHHVIDGAKKIKVRLNGEKDDVSGQVDCRQRDGRHGPAEDRIARRQEARAHSAWPATAEDRRGRLRPGLSRSDEPEYHARP